MRCKLFGLLLGVAMLIPLVAANASATTAGTQSLGSYRQIKNFWTGKCLTGRPGKVHPDTCRNNDDQLWLPVGNGSTSMFVLRSTGMCLDADNDEAPNPPGLDGSPMQTYFCFTGITSENWTVQTLDPFSGRTRITSSLGNYCLDDNNGNSPTVIWTCFDGEHNQDWAFG